MEARYGGAHALSSVVTSPGRGILSTGNRRRPNVHPPACIRQRESDGGIPAGAGWAGRLAGSGGSHVQTGLGTPATDRFYTRKALMKVLRVNDYDMTYLELGSGRPLVCIHGSLNDFRAWMGVLKPCRAGTGRSCRACATISRELGRQRAVPSRCPSMWMTSLRSSMPWASRRLTLIGHSRGGHLACLALKRPDLIRQAGARRAGRHAGRQFAPGDDAGVRPGPGRGSRAHVSQAAEKIEAGDLDGGLKAFIDGINGPGAWDALPAIERQMRQTMPIRFWRR